MDMDGHKAFGTPVTNETLKAMPRYAGKEITVLDGAREALAMINSEDKDANALRHGEETKAKCCEGPATLIMVYNATGNTINYITKHDWNGLLVSEKFYPKSIANGQWVSFIHGHKKLPGIGSGSSGAIVYRCNNPEKGENDWMFSWANNVSSRSEKAYTEIREVGHFPDNDGNIWKKLEHLAYNSLAKWDDEAYGLCANVSVCYYNNMAVYKAILSINTPDQAGN